MADRELLGRSLSAILDLLGDVEPCDCPDTDKHCPIVNARKTADALRERLAQPEQGGRTGWPAGMLQDDSRELSKALASKPGARRLAREAAEAVRLAREGALDRLAQIDREVGLWPAPARQEQEPVAWLHAKTNQAFTSEPPPGLKAECQALYTAPRREWVGLSAEEIGEEAREIYGSSHWDDIKFARAIEAKLREKNGA